MQRCLITKLFRFADITYYITPLLLLLLLLFWSQPLYYFKQNFICDRNWTTGASLIIYIVLSRCEWGPITKAFLTIWTKVLKFCGLNQYTVWETIRFLNEWPGVRKKKRTVEIVGLKDVLSVWGESGGKWMRLQSSLLSRGHASFTSGSNDIDYQHSSISLPK